MNASIAIIGLYAGLCALILLWISAKTSTLRQKYRVSVGDGGNKHLHRIMRGHSNAVENMSIILILLIIMAAMGSPSYVLHGFGAALVISRFFHAWHFIQEDAPRWQRFYSSVATLLIILTAAIGVITHSLVILLN